MSDYLVLARRRLAELRAVEVNTSTYEINEINEISPTVAVCWICGDDANGATNGRNHCAVHAPATPTVRALWQACALYDQLYRESLALVDGGQRVPAAVLDSYYTAGAEVFELARRVRADERANG